MIIDHLTSMSYLIDWLRLWKWNAFKTSGNWNCSNFIFISYFFINRHVFDQSPFSEYPRSKKGTEQLGKYPVCDFILIDGRYSDWRPLSFLQHRKESVFNPLNYNKRRIERTSVELEQVVEREMKRQLLTTIYHIITKSSDDYFVETDSLWLEQKQKAKMWDSCTERTKNWLSTKNWCLRPSFHNWINNNFSCQENVVEKCFTSWICQTINCMWDLLFFFISLQIFYRHDYSNVHGIESAFAYSLYTILWHSTCSLLYTRFMISSFSNYVLNKSPEEHIYKYWILQVFLKYPELCFF